jgi:IS30 family transposase
VAGNGLKVKDVAEIKRLWKLKITNRQIAKILGVHRNTINKYVEQLEMDLRAPTAAGTTVNVSAAQVDPCDVNKVDWERVRSEFLSGISLNVIYEEL